VSVSTPKPVNATERSTENIALIRYDKARVLPNRDTIKPVRTQHFASATPTTNMTAATAKKSAKIATLAN